MSKFRWYGKKLIDKLEAGTERALTKFAIIIVNAAKTLMAEPKHGAPVPPGQGSRGGHPWQKRTRSAPGEAPAVQTGQLRGRVAYTVPGKGVRHVGTNVKHGFYQEVGTERILPRPWLRPAFYANEKKLPELLKKEARI